MQRRTFIGRSLGNAVNFQQVGSRTVAWRVTIALAVAAAALLASHPAQAAVTTWNPASVSGNVDWTDPANWITALTSGDSVVFGADSVFGTSISDVLNNNENGFSIGGITFSAGAPAYTLNEGGFGNFLTGNILNSSTLTQTINLNLETTAVRTVTMTAGGGNVILGGIIAGAGGGITTAGAGTLTLGGANTYDALTTVAAGTTLVASGSNSSAGGTTLTGGTLQLNNAANGGLAGGMLTLTSGTLQALGAARSLSNDSSLTAATVSGSQSINLNGKLTGLTGNSRTLTSSISGGTLTLANVDISDDTGTARTLTIAGTGNTTVTGAIADGLLATTANGLTITNTGTTTLSGSSTYTGATLLTGAGTLSLTGTLQFTNITVNNAAATFNESGTGVIVGGPTNTFTLTAGSATLGGANSYGGLTTVTAGSMVFAGSNSSAGKTTLAGGTTQLASATANNGGLAGGLLTLSGGALQATSVAPLAISNTVSLTAATTVSGAQSLTLNGDLSQTASSTLTSSITGGQSLTLAGNVNIDAVTGTALTLTIGGTGPTNITGLIRDYSGGLGTSHGALTINNSNTTTFSNNNTYAGTNTVNKGTLATSLGGNGTPFGAGAITIDAGTLSAAPSGGGNIVYIGANLAATTLFSYRSATVALNRGSQTSVTLMVGGSGASPLTRTGQGLLIISSNFTDLGGGENFVVGGTSTPTITNGMVNASIVGLGATTAGAGDFLAYGATYGYTGFGAVTTFVGANGDTNFTAPTNVKVENVTTSWSVAANTAVYALRTNSAITVSPGVTLTVGSNSGQAGVILNGASISGGALAFGAAEGIVYGFNGGGSISSTITGTAGVTIGGNSTVTFSGVNTYTGTTTVTSGALTLTGVNASTLTANGGALNLSAFGLATSGTVTVGGAATSSLTESVAYAITNTAALTVSGGTANLSQANRYSGATAVSGGTLNLTAAGAINGSAVTVSNAAGVLNLSTANALTGTSTLTVSNGTVNITAAQNYTGTTVISGGTVNISGSGAFGNTAIAYSGGTLSLQTANAITQNTLSEDGGNVTQTVANAISGTASLTFTNSSGPLSWANNYTGNTTVYGGGNGITVNGSTGVCGTTLDFSQPSSPLTNIINNGLATGTGSRLVLVGGELNVFGKNGAANSQEFNGLTLNAGPGAVTANIGTGGTMSVALNAITRNVGSTVVFGNAQNGIFGAITTTAANANFSGGQATILGGWATMGSINTVSSQNGTTWAVSAGNGVSAGLITGLATGSYTPNTGNVLTSGKDIDMSVAGGANVTGNQTINSLRFNNNLANTVTISSSQTLTIATGGILNTTGANATATTITGGSITSGNGQDLIIHQYNGTAAMTINSAIVNNGTTGLTVNAGGTLIIGGTNTFSGPLTIGAGTLKLGSAGALNGQPNVVFGFTGVSSGILDLNGNSATISGLSDTLTGIRAGQINGGLAITSSGGPATLTINMATSSTYDGGFTNGTGGTLALTKAGAGTLTLTTNPSNNNNGNLLINYTGATTVNGGTILLTGQGYRGTSLASSSELILGPGTTQGMSFTTTFGTAFSIGSLGGSGNEALLQTNGSSGVTMTLNNAIANFVDPTTGLAPNYSGVLSGPGSLTINGTQPYTQILSGANTFTGGVSLGGAAGTTLQLGNARALGSILSTLTMNTTTASSTILDLRGNNATTNLTGTYVTPGIAAAKITNNATATPATLFIGYNNASNTFAGTLADGTSTLALTKVGTGTQTLQGVSTYLGGTTVNGGTLIEDMSFYPAATATGNQTPTNALAAAGTLTVEGGNFTLKGRNNSTLAATTATATWASGSNVITFAAAQAVVPGQTVASAGTGFPVGAYIVNVATDQKSIVISLPTTAANGTAVALTPLGAATATNAQTFNTINYGAATIGLNNNNGTSTTLNAGTLARSGNGTLVISPTGGTVNTNLGVKENFLVTGTAPVLTNGIVNTSIVGQTTNVGDFLTYDGTKGFVIFDYTTGDQNFILPSSTTVENVTAAQTGLASNSVFALRAAAGIGLASGATLTVGNPGTGTGQSNQAGVILNGQTISATAGTATLAFGAAEGTIYTGADSTISTVISGTGGLTKFGPGQLSLSGSNTFTGTLRINAGTIQYTVNDTGTVSGPLGSTSNTVVLDGGRLFNQGGDGILMNASHALVLGPGAVGGSIDANNRSKSFSGNISGAGMLVISNANGGFLTLNGNNTYTGGTSILNSILSIAADANIGGSSATIVFPASGTLEITGTTLQNFGTHNLYLPTGNNTLVMDIANAANTFTMNQSLVMSINSGGNAPLQKTGAGTLILTGASTYTQVQATYGTALSGGLLILDASQGGAVSPTGNSFVFRGGTFEYRGKTSGTTTQTITNVYGGSGGGTIVVNNQSGTGTTTLNLGSFQTFSAGSSLNLKTANVGSGAAVITTTSANDVSGIVGAGRVTYGGADWATLAATGTTLGAYTGYNTSFPTDGTSSGIVNYSQTNSPASPLSASESVYSLKLIGASSGQSLDLNGNTLTITSGGLLYTGANGYAINNGTLKSNVPTASDLIVHQAGTGTLTIVSTIADGIGASTLTKAGSGTLALATIFGNTYTGQTYVNSGVLSINADNQLSAAQLNLNGGTLQVTGSFGSSRAVQFGGSGGTFDVTGGNTYTVSSGITAALSSGNGFGAGGLTLTSTGGSNDGLLILSGGNVFGGGITIKNGTLRAANTAALNAGGVNNIIFDSATTTGVLQLNGNSAIVNGIVGPAAAIVENGNTSGAPVTLTVNPGDNETFAGKLQNGVSAAALSVVKGGGGTWTLTNASTYTGPTAVNGGTLMVTGSIAGTSGVTVVPSAVLDLANTASGGTALALTTAYTPVVNNGTLNVSSTNEKASAISGTGSTNVLASASLTADSIVQNTLSIGAGGVVTIRETTGGSVSSVPEPGTWVLIGTALMGWLAFRRRQR